MKYTGAKWFQIVMVALTLEITLITNIIVIISILIEIITNRIEINARDFK